MRLPLESFVASTCELAAPLEIFIAVYSLTNGEPCNGCGYDGHGQHCKAKAELFAAPTKRAPVQAPSETVRETAERLGVSISEVRRRRKSANEAHQ